MKKEEFKDYKVKADETIADMYVKFKPLASTLQVDLKVNKVKGEFERNLKGLSKKEDCSRDKEEAKKAGNNLRYMVEELAQGIDQLQEEVQKHAEAINRKAEETSIRMIAK